MKRAFIILGSLVLAGTLAYFIMHEEQTPEVIEIPWEPVPAESAEANTPPSPVTDKTAPADDEDVPKPVSPSREKFESDDDAEDTDDGLTIEVEEEE